jgi:hypothetical protein
VDDRLKLWLPSGVDRIPQPLHDLSPHNDFDESLLGDKIFDPITAKLDLANIPDDDEDDPLGFVMALRASAVTGNVPFTRVLRFGMRGADVIAYKRALSRAGYMQWGSFTDLFGENMVRAVSKFRHVHGLGTQGSIGVRTHTALTLAYKKGSRSERAMDDRARQILDAYHTAHSKSPERLKREAIVAEWHFLWTQRFNMPYAQLRPVPLVKPPDFPRRGTDCSGHIMLGYFVAGARNPNVFDGHVLPWNGQGYTGTIMAAGVECDYSDLELADVVMYGRTTRPSGAFPYGSPTHVAGFIGAGRVSSNGSHPMREDSVHYRGDVNCYIHLEV